MVKTQSGVEVSSGADAEGSGGGGINGAINSVDSSGGSNSSSG